MAKLLVLALYANMQFVGFFFIIISGRSWILWSGIILHEQCKVTF